MKKYELSTTEQTMFNDNLKLVDYTLYRFFSYSTIKGIGLNEAKSVGCLGLVHAIKSYNESKGTKFSTHAIGNIRYAILNALKSSFRPREYECIEDMRETELSGRIVGNCKYLLQVDCFTNYIDYINDEQNVDRLHKLAKKTLSDRYYQIYSMAYIEGLQPVEIAKKLGVTRARAYALLRKIARILKERIKIEDDRGEQVI